MTVAIFNGTMKQVNLHRLADVIALSATADAMAKHHADGTILITVKTNETVVRQYVVVDGKVVIK